MSEEVAESFIPQLLRGGGFQLENRLPKHTEAPRVRPLDHSQDVQEKRDSTAAGLSKGGRRSGLEVVGEIFHNALRTPVPIGPVATDVLAEDRNHRGEREGRGNASLFNMETESMSKKPSCEISAFKSCWMRFGTHSNLCP